MTPPPWRRRPDWASLPPPEPCLRSCVVIPVRNEASNLPATLGALEAQRTSAGERLDPRSFEVIVLANNCSDDSAAVVRRFAAARRRLRLHVVEARFPRPLAHVGHARACLMNEAARRVGASAGSRGVIASTDGDSRVAPDWLDCIVRTLDAGADAVGGKIIVEQPAAAAGLARLMRRDERYQALRCRLEHLLDPDPADPWPRHHQHFGASLAVTAAAYARAGGLPAEPFLEDEAFYQALRAHDLTLRHSELVRVVTSNRRDGRVAVGLSWQLREWQALARGNEDARVEDPNAWAEGLRCRRRLRECWRGQRGESAQWQLGELRALALALGVSSRWLRDQLDSSAAFGALWAAVLARREARRQAPPARVPMRAAIDCLRELIALERAATSKSASRTRRPSACSPASAA